LTSDRAVGITARQSKRRRVIGLPCRTIGKKPPGYIARNVACCPTFATPPFAPHVSSTLWFASAFHNLCHYTADTSIDSHLPKLSNSSAGFVAKDTTCEWIGCGPIGFDWTDWMGRRPAGSPSPHRRPIRSPSPGQRPGDRGNEIQLRPDGPSVWPIRGESLIRWTDQPLHPSPWSPVLLSYQIG
jgi:hypothetical protein